MRLIFHKILDKLGYYCYNCGRYKKRFSPPCGRSVCLDCQLRDARHYSIEQDCIIYHWHQGELNEEELADQVERLDLKYGR